MQKDSFYETLKKFSNENSFFQKKIEKVICWFSWSEKNLYAYNVVNKKFCIKKLVIPFLVPEYSRSTVTREGKLFLIGGDFQHFEKKRKSSNVYAFDLAYLD